MPEDVVRRRSARSLANLPAYVALCDLWRIYEASGPTPRLALEGRGAEVTYRDAEQLAVSHPAIASLANAMNR